MTIREWPFPAGPAHYTPRQQDTEDEREEDSPPSQFCECDLPLTVSEITSGRCSACGKAIA